VQTISVVIPFGFAALSLYFIHSTTLQAKERGRLIFIKNTFYLKTDLEESN